jgi:CHAT domain-containing protein/tetratricopeptide (TPR) repeat protein
MIRKRLAWWPGLLMLFFAPAVTGQTPSPSSGPLLAPGLRELSVDDEKRAKELDQAIESAQKADRWDEAISRAEELLALRTRTQGPKHFEAASAKWRLTTLRRVASMSKEDRVAYQSAHQMSAQGNTLLGQAKSATAQPLFEKALEIRRRLLTDDHPETAESYDGLAHAIWHQGKFAAAQPLYEKALDIRRGVLGDAHPATAHIYNDLALMIKLQGKFARAQALYEKALEIYRRALGDDHLATAPTYHNLAACLVAQGDYAVAQPLVEKALEIQRRGRGDENANTAFCFHGLAKNLYVQGKYAEAQPLFEKALEIRRGKLTEDHPDTAISYRSLGLNLRAQGKYDLAQPLFEKSLDIFRRAFPDDLSDISKGYGDLAENLDVQGDHAAAQPIFEKALEYARRGLTDDHPDVGDAYRDLAKNLQSQGKYVQAQQFFEKSLEIDRQLLGDDHSDTVEGYNGLASSLNSQGRYLEARDRWLSAVRSLDKARLRVAFTGLERAVKTAQSERPALAAVLARLGQPAEAWQALEEDLGRGLLDELAARRDHRLTPAERSRLRELTDALERLDLLAEAKTKDLDQSERAKRLAELKHQRELASIALGEFQTGLIRDHPALAGPVATLDQIQAALPADAAFIAWVDIPPKGPNEADPDGEHWGVVVRSQGVPAWIPIAGTGPNGLWTDDDTGLAARMRKELQDGRGIGSSDLRSQIERLRKQRFEPLAKALGDTAAGQAPARTLIVLPSRAMAGIPVEMLLAVGDTRTVSYAPSATVYKYLREQPRTDRHAGLLALGDPVFQRPDASSEPIPPPDHGLLVNVVAPGSNAAAHDLKPGDILLSYGGRALYQKGDLKVVGAGDKPIGVEIWRDGRSFRHDIAPGDLGVEFDPRPAPSAILEQRKMQQVLMAARTGGEHFAPLPGTRHEVEALARLFNADGRPARLLLGADASEPELDRLAASGELGRYGFIHLATHGVIDEGFPTRSAVILTQTGLPDPLEQALNHRPVLDGRLSVREMQHAWELKAELVTLSACETALGRAAGGEGFVGFTQALLISGTRSVVLSLWKVDDKATALLMARFYQNLLGKRDGLSRPMPKAEALHEAKEWLRNLSVNEVGSELAALDRGTVRPLVNKADGSAPHAASRTELVERGIGEEAVKLPEGGRIVPSSTRKASGVQPYAHPYYWASFILIGDPR